MITTKSELILTDRAFKREIMMEINRLIESDDYRKSYIDERCEGGLQKYKPLYILLQNRTLNEITTEIVKCIPQSYSCDLSPHDEEHRTIVTQHVKKYLYHMMGSEAAKKMGRSDRPLGQLLATVNEPVESGAWYSHAFFVDSTTLGYKNVVAAADLSYVAAALVFLVLAFIGEDIPVSSIGLDACDFRNLSEMIAGALIGDTHESYLIGANTINERDNDLKISKC